MKAKRKERRMQVMKESMGGGDDEPPDGMILDEEAVAARQGFNVSDDEQNLLTFDESLGEEESSQKMADDKPVDELFLAN